MYKLELHAVATYFLIVGRETPARESSGLALTHSWLISKRIQQRYEMVMEKSSETGNCGEVTTG